MRIIDQIRSVDKLAVNHAVVDQVCTVLALFFHYYAVLSSKGKNTAERTFGTKPLPEG